MDLDEEYHRADSWRTIIRWISNGPTLINLARVCTNMHKLVCSTATHFSLDYNCTLPVDSIRKWPALINQLQRVQYLSVWAVNQLQMPRAIVGLNVKGLSDTLIHIVICCVNVEHEFKKHYGNSTPDQPAFPNLRLLTLNFMNDKLAFQVGGYQCRTQIRSSREVPHEDYYPYITQALLRAPITDLSIFMNLTIVESRLCLVDCILPDSVRYLTVNDTSDVPLVVPFKDRDNSGVLLPVPKGIIGLYLNTISSPSVLARFPALKSLTIRQDLNEVKVREVLKYMPKTVSTLSLSDFTTLTIQHVAELPDTLYQLECGIIEPDAQEFLPNKLSNLTTGTLWCELDILRVLDVQTISFGSNDELRDVEELFIRIPLQQTLKLPYCLVSLTVSIAANIVLDLHHCGSLESIIISYSSPRSAYKQFKKFPFNITSLDISGRIPVSNLKYLAGFKRLLQLELECNGVTPRQIENANLPVSLQEVTINGRCPRLVDYHDHHWDKFLLNSP